MRLRNSFPAFAILGSILVLGACADDKTATTPDGIATTCSESGDEDCLETASGALVLAPEDDAANGITTFTMVNPTTFEVTGTGPGVNRFTQGGTILRGVPGFGLVIGRITAVTPVGNDTRRVTFVRARIQDVIPRARIRTKRHVTCTEAPNDKTQMVCNAVPVAPGPLWGTADYLAAERAKIAAAAVPLQSIDSRAAALGVSNCKRDFISDGPVDLGLTQCHFTVEFDVDVNLSWGWLLPDAFSASVSVIADAGLELTGTLTAGYSTHPDDVKLVSLGSIQFTVGGIPLYVSGSIYGGYTLDLAAAASFVAGFDYDATETFGFGWASGDGIYKIRSSDRTKSRTGPTFTIDGTVTASAYLRPELEFGVGVSGFLSAGATIGLELGASLHGEVHTEGNGAEACLSLDLYATPSLGYHLNIFNLIDESGSFALADWSTQLFPVDGDEGCVSWEEQENPSCGSGSECNSHADCEFQVGDSVSDVPSGVTPAAADAICIEATCAVETSGTSCGCDFKWLTNCCTSDAQCGTGALCNNNYCVCPIYGSGCNPDANDDRVLLEFAIIKDFTGAEAECVLATACDDERDATADTCQDGDCVHTYEGARPGVVQCDKDSACPTVPNGRSFCTGGICLTETIDRCDIKSCDDGNVRTRDICTDGACTHTNESILPPQGL